MLVTLAAIASFVCMGISNFVGPFVTRRTPVFTVVAAGQLTPALILGLVLALLARPLPGIDFLLIGIGLGVLSAAGTTLAFKAGQIGNIGLVAVILSLSAIIPAVAGILDGERPPVYQWFGIVLAAGGTGLTLLTGERDQSPSGTDGGAVQAAAGMPVGAGAVPTQAPPAMLTALKRAGTKWPLLATTAALVFGIFMLGLSQLAKEDLIWVTFLNRTGLVVAAAIVIVATGRPLLSPGGKRRQLLPLPFLGISMTAATLLYGYAATSMLTIASALTAFAPVVAVSLSWIFLRDRLTRSQILGIGITVCGLVLIAV